MKTKPDLSFWKLWNLSFGFFGVQIAYALQSAQVSRIFSTIGADPHDLSYFWILPPLMGLVVQPIIGVSSDRTWTRLGRRLPYLLIGAAAAIIVMCFLPNAGSLGFTVSSAIIFGLIMLMFLDTSINMAMQPFKMLVGDFVNEKQKGLAYSIQSALCNAGSVVGYIAPIILALFLPNVAPKGEVPPTVTWSFYIGAIVLLLCVVYTFATVREMPPAEYAAYHGIKEEATSKKKEKGDNILKVLANAPKVFWTVGLVQFFCWAAFLYMWSYGTDAIAAQVFDAPSVEHVDGVKIGENEYKGKYIFCDNTPVINDGNATISGIEIDGVACVPEVVVLEGDTLINGTQVAYKDGFAKVDPNGGILAQAGKVLVIDGVETAVASEAKVVPTYSTLPEGAQLTIATIAKYNDETGLFDLEQTENLPAIAPGQVVELSTSTVLNAASPEYQAAGNWNGVILAIQAGAALLWAIVLPMFRNRRTGYSVSLLIGAVGFISVFFVHNQWLLAVSYALVGCAWAAMLAMPFTILTNALSGKNIGTYLGLFNCTICIPQIVAAICGGLILKQLPLGATGAPMTVLMLVVSGVLLLLGAIAVWNIKETYGSNQVAEPKPDFTEQELI